MAVNTVGSGGTYSTLAAWEADAPATLSEMWEAEVMDTIAVTTTTTLGGSTPSATAYKYARPADGQDFATVTGSGRIGGAISGAGNNCSASADASIILSEQYSAIEGLKFTYTGSAAGTFLSIAGADTLARRCFFRSRPSASAPSSLVTISGARLCLISCLFEHSGSNSGDEMLRFANAPTTADGSDAPNILYNSFVVTSTDASANPMSARCTAIERNAAAGTRRFRMIGNVFAGFATLFTGSSTCIFTDDSGYNLTTLAAGSTDYTDKFPDGIGGNKYAADIAGTWSDAGVLFVNTTYANGDWRPSPTGALAAAGITVSSPTNPVGAGGATQRGGVTHDLLGVARAGTPYLGAIEGAALEAAMLHRIARLRQGISPIFYFNRNFT